MENEKKIAPPDFDGAAHLRFMEKLNEEKEILRIIGKMAAPIDKVLRVAKMFECRACREGQNSRCLVYLDLYNYGYMMGIRAERQKRRGKA